MAVGALVCGILSVVFCWLNLFGSTGIIPLALGILGIVFGALGLKKGQGGKATAGLVLAIIGTAISGIWFVACVACAGVLGSAAAYM